MYRKPLDKPYVKENCTTRFNMTSLSSLGAMQPSHAKAEVRLLLWILASTFM